MSAGPSVPPDRVPTLTEVVAWPEPAPPTAEPGGDAPARALAEAGSGAAPTASPSFNEEQLTQRVLIDLQRQMDLMLDYRLREVLTPLLARAADGIVREARSELASTLRDVVERAVAQELARHRTR
ncbi:MAG TPA: hypothetical protein VNU48_00010 [Burkholderiaceae bacterium]|nr:hypothetical protein [Burkholderiaceae bacterium]